MVVRLIEDVGFSNPAGTFVFPSPPTTSILQPYSASSGPLPAYAVSAVQPREDKMWPFALLRLIRLQPEICYLRAEWLLSFHHETLSYPESPVHPQRIDILRTRTVKNSVAVRNQDRF